MLKQNVGDQSWWFPRTEHGAPPSFRAVAAAQIKRYRERKGWSQERLAEEMSNLGHPTARLTILKTESGERKVAIDELYVLGMALDVPVLLLLLPLGISDKVEVPGELRAIHPALVWKHFIGDEPYVRDADRRVARHVTTWHENATPVWLFRRFDELAERTGQQQALSKADAGSESEVRRVRFEMSVRHLFEHIELMENVGLQGIPTVPESWAVTWELIRGEDAQ